MLLELARRGSIHVVASRLVIREAERNLRRKAHRSAAHAFHRFLEEIPLVVVPTPESGVLARYEAAIHPKDVPVLAAAIEAKVDYLVTLDRKHFFTKAVLSRVGHLKVLTPGEFLKRFMRAG